jgi:hypothetical protein
VVQFTNGVAKWSYELGSSFLELTDRKFKAIRGGRLFVGDLVPPSIPTWASGTDWILGNSYNPQTGLIDLQIEWLSGHEADLHRFLVEYQRADESYAHFLPFVNYPTQTVSLTGMPVSTDITFRVRAYDTHGNPLTNLDAYWSEAKTLTTEVEADVTPPTAFAVAESGITKHGLAWRRLSWVASVYGYVERYEIEWWITGDPTNKDSFFTGEAATSAVPPDTDVALDYSYRIRSIERYTGRAGAWTSTITSTVYPVPVTDGDGGTLDFDTDAPGVLFSNWPEDLVTVTGVATIGDRTRTTANVRNGRYSMRLDVPTASKLYSHSNHVAIPTGRQLSLWLAYIASAATGTAEAYLQWGKMVGDVFTQVGVDVAIISATPTTSWVEVTPVPQTAPATVTCFRLKLGLTTGVPTNILDWAAPIWSLSRGSTDIADGAIGDTQLDVITDPSKLALITPSTDPRYIRDGTNAIRGEEHASTTSVQIVGVQTGGLDIGVGLTSSVGNSIEAGGDENNGMIADGGANIIRSLLGTQVTGISETDPVASFNASTIGTFTDNLIEGSDNGNTGFRITAAGEYAKWDGTRWLSPPVLFPLHNYLGSAPFSATTEALAGGVPGNFTFLIERWDVGWYTGVTQNGTDYWDISLRRLQSDGGTVDTVKTVNTQSQPNGAIWNKVSASSGFSNNPLNATDIWLQVYIVPHGSPGSLYLQSNIFGRFVYT